MGETEKTRGARQHAEAVVQELVAARVTGKALQEQLAAVVRRLVEEGVSQAEARLLLQRVYKRDRCTHSAEFHKRVRAATRETSHFELKQLRREQTRAHLDELWKKTFGTDSPVKCLPANSKKTNLH